MPTSPGEGDAETQETFRDPWRATTQEAPKRGAESPLWAEVRAGEPSAPKSPSQPLQGNPGMREGGRSRGAAGNGKRHARGRSHTWARLPRQAPAGCLGALGEGGREEVAQSPARGLPRPEVRSRCLGRRGWGSMASSLAHLTLADSRSSSTPEGRCAARQGLRIPG